MVEQKVELRQTCVNIYNREKLEITGVVEVLSSSEKEIFAKLGDSIAHITGNKMKITKLIPDEMLLVVSGSIDGVVYESKQTKKSFLKKVFKWCF